MFKQKLFSLVIIVLYCFELVLLQNTRARERKGQFRAHAQVINKRCPFCPALFKVKSALETHLAAKHADQYTKGDINIDALPDEELDSSSSPLRDNTKVPISFGASTTNSLGAAPTSPSSNTNLIAPFLHSLSTHAELESSLKKLYEESLKRYAHEVQAAGNQQNGRAETQTPTDLRMMKGEAGAAAEFTTNPGGEIPLDLSKPVDLSRAFGKIEALDMDNDYLSGKFCIPLNFLNLLNVYHIIVKHTSPTKKVTLYLCTRYTYTLYFLNSNNTTQLTLSESRRFYSRNLFSLVIIMT